MWRSLKESCPQHIVKFRKRVKYLLNQVQIHDDGITDFQGENVDQTIIETDEVDTTENELTGNDQDVAAEDDSQEKKKRKKRKHKHDTDIHDDSEQSAKKNKNKKKLKD